jgi:hypothetical protein
MSRKTNPVLFIHGLWLHPTSWAAWATKFEQPVTPPPVPDGPASQTL